MKKHIFYVLLVTAMLTLGACSSDTTEETLATMGSLEVEETEEAVEEEVFDWFELTVEEQENLINDALLKYGYVNVVAQELLSPIEQEYTTLGNSNAPFDYVFGLAIETLQTPQIQDWNQQVGNESYTNRDKSTLLYVFEKDDTIVAIHGSFDFYTSFYSYAKDGVWVEKDIPLMTEEEADRSIQEAGLSPKAFDYYYAGFTFVNDYVYIGLLNQSFYSAADGENIGFTLVWSDTGFTKETTSDLFYDANVVKTNKGRMAYVDYQDDKRLIIPFDDPEKNAIQTYQPTESLDSRFNTETNGRNKQIFYFENIGRMVLGESKIYILDTTTGDLLWDSSGQPLTLDFPLRDYRVEFYSEEIFGAFREYDNTFRLLDRDFYPLGVEIALPIYLEDKFFTTSTDETITAWQSATFQGRPSLQFVKIKKGPDVY